MLNAECSFSQTRSPRSMNFEHAIERHARPVLNVVLHFNLIDDVAFREVFQGPAQMLRRDAEHSRAKTTRIVQRDDLLPFRSEFLADRKSTRLNSSHLVISYAV